MSLISSCKGGPHVTFSQLKYVLKESLHVSQTWNSGYIDSSIVSALNPPSHSQENISSRVRQTGVRNHYTNSHLSSLGLLVAVTQLTDYIPAGSAFSTIPRGDLYLRLNLGENLSLLSILTPREHLRKRPFSYTYYLRTFLSLSSPRTSLSSIVRERTFSKSYFIPVPRIFLEECYSSRKDVFVYKRRRAYSQIYPHTRTNYWKTKYVGFCPSTLFEDFFSHQQFVDGELLKTA